MSRRRTRFPEGVSMSHGQISSRMQPALSVLPNGMQVLIQEDQRYPLVVMRLYVRSGSAYERPSEIGISHLLEHMAFKGTAGGEPGLAARRIEGAGGVLNAATGFDQTVYMVDLPAEHWSLGIESLFQLCSPPALQEEELQREKEVVLSELEKNEDNPRHCLFERMQERVFSGTGYEHPIIGSRDSIRGLRPEDINAYITRTYLPQAMLLVVCGRVKPAEVLKRTQGLFEGMRTGRVLASPLGSCGRDPGPGLSVVPTQWKKGYLAFGFPAPALSAVDSTHLELAAYILGGDSSSRWYAHYRYEKALLDEFGISPVLLERAGMFFVNAQLDPQQLTPFCREWLRDLSGLKKVKLSRSELERAKVNMEDVLQQAKETLSGLASKIGHFQFFEKSVEAEDRYLDQIRRAGKADVQAAMTACLRPERMQCICLLPEDCGLSAADVERELRVPPVRPQRRENPVSRQSRKGFALHDLGQGCRMVLLPDDTLPYTAIDLTWAGGDQLLRPGEQGLAALTARTLIKGAGPRDAQQIRELLSRRAGYLQGMANRDQMSILAKFPSRFSSELLGLLRDVVLRPAFETREVAMCAADQANRVIERCDHPLGRLSREIFPFLFPGHAYGYYHLGDPAGLGNFQQSDLQRFWGQQSQCPWVLSICGNFDRREIEATARALMNPSGHQPCSWSFPEWSREKHLRLEMNNRNQAHILLVFPVPGQGSPLDPVTALTKKILAGQDGILFKELRDRQGLGYAVSPMLSSNPGVGFLGFYIGTSAEKVDQAVAAFQAVISELQRDSVRAEHLDRARNMLQAEYYRERQGLISRCSEASDLLVAGLGLEYYQDMMEKARSVDPSAIREFARDYLQWDSRYSMILRTG